MREILLAIGYPEPGLSIQRELGKRGYKTELVYTCSEIGKIIGALEGTNTDAVILGSDIISAFPDEARNLVELIYGRKGRPIPLITCMMQPESRVLSEVRELAKLGDYVVSHPTEPLDPYFALRCLEDYGRSGLGRSHEVSLQALRSMGSKL